MKTALVRIAAFAVLSGFMFPFNQTVAPEWDVTVLDADHRPLPNINVREVWQQYSVDDTSHQEDRQSDANGRVHFQRRQQRSNLLQRAGGCVRRIVGSGVHSGCGPAAWIVAFGPTTGSTDWADLEQQLAQPGEHQRSVLVARPHQAR